MTQDMTQDMTQARKFLTRMVCALSVALIFTASTAMGGVDGEAGVAAKPKARQHSQPHQHDQHDHAGNNVRITARWHRANMSDNVMGSRNASTAQVLAQGYRIVPQDMTTDMFTFGWSRRMNNGVRLSASVPYVIKRMQSVTYTQTETLISKFTTQNDGVGDAMLRAGKKLRYKGWHGSLGVSVPLGSVDAADRILLPNGVITRRRLPYMMQIGTGTFDLHPAISFVNRFGAKDNMTFGFQLNGVVHLGTNHANYAFGDKAKATVSFGRHMLNGHGRLSLSYQSTDRIEGRDSEIFGASQMADPENYGGERLLAKVSYRMRNGVSVQLATPLHEDLHGTQMSLSHIFGVNYMSRF